MTPDSELLQRYADLHDQAAFRAWVERRLDLVYSVALRVLNGDVHLAQDVAQLVFTDAARRARELADHPAVSAWLFTSTRFAAAKLVRTQQRRRHRELTAAMDPNLPDPSIDWDAVRPVIDEALAELTEDDRTAVLLRFFERADYETIGRQLDIAPNTARMRVQRGLARLSDRLSRRGITSTLSALGAALAANAVSAAPAGLATSVAATSLAAVTLASTTLSLLTMIKIPLALTAVVVASGVSLLTLEHRTQAALRDRIAAPPPAASSTTTAPAARPAPVVVAPSAPAVTDGDYAKLESEVSALQSRLADLDRAPRAIAVRSGQPVLKPSARISDALDRAPRPTQQVRPVYPAELRKLGLEGEAVIAIVIDSEGNVRSPEAVSATNEAFAQAALAAVSAWHFEPGTKGGKQVNTRIQVPIKFTLSSTQMSADEWF